MSLAGQPLLPARAAEPPRTPEEAGVRADHARAMNEVLLGIDYLRYEMHLTERDRSVAHGLKFPGSPLFVTHAAKGVLENPHLFSPAEQERARLFAARQSEADALFDLRNTLGVMLAVVQDNYLEAQGDAIRSALQFVRRVQREFELEDCDPRSPEAARVDGIYGALLLLRDYYQSIKGRARRGERPASAAAKRRGESQGRAMWAETLRFFQRLLRSGPLANSARQR